MTNSGSFEAEYQLAEAAKGIVERAETAGWEHTVAEIELAVEAFRRTLFNGFKAFIADGDWLTRAARRASLEYALLPLDARPVITRPSRND